MTPSRLFLRPVVVLTVRVESCLSMSAGLLLVVNPRQYCMQAMLQGAAQDSEKYKDYVQTSTIEDVQIADAPYHSTLCNVCQTVCHDHCNLDELSDAGQICHQLGCGNSLAVL